MKRILSLQENMLQTGSRYKGWWPGNSIRTRNLHREVVRCDAARFRTDRDILLMQLLLYEKLIVNLAKSPRLQSIDAEAVEIVFVKVMETFKYDEEMHPAANVLWFLTCAVRRIARTNANYLERCYVKPESEECHVVDALTNLLRDPLLTDRERAVLEAHLIDHRSLADIGEQFKLTKQRIERIEDMAVIKLTGLKKRDLLKNSVYKV